MTRLRDVKRRIREGAEDIADDVSVQTMLRIRSDPRILARWRSYCGAETDDAIDYDDPCVRIEYMAADPVLHSLAARDGERFLERTGCDRETFMRYYDQSAESP